MAAPPQTHFDTKADDKDADAVVGLQDVPFETAETGVPADIDQEYLNASWKTRFWRGVLLQMILFGA